jgi:hypothetical protein
MSFFGVKDGKEKEDKTLNTYDKNGYYHIVPHQDKSHDVDGTKIREVFRNNDMQSKVSYIIDKKL